MFVNYNVIYINPYYNLRKKDCLWYSNFQVGTLFCKYIEEENSNSSLFFIYTFGITRILNVKKDEYFYNAGQYCSHPSWWNDFMNPKNMYDEKKYRILNSNWFEAVHESDKYNKIIIDDLSFLHDSIKKLRKKMELC